MFQNVFVTSKAAIRAVYDDPQVEGMASLYTAIGEKLQQGISFDDAYAQTIAAGGSVATTWIRFCVQCSTRFEEPPLEADFLAVLQAISREHMGL